MLTYARLLTLALALGGAFFFQWLNVPLPFLFGPMAVCLMAALAGVRLQGMGQVSVAARSVLGVAVGASITPALVGQLPGMAASVALVPFYILLIGLLGVPFFYRICRFDLVTSYYASMPGGLQDMLIFGEEAGADVRALSLIHATRVLVVIVLVPFVITHAYGLEISRPIGAPISELPMSEIALMAFAAILGWKGGERIGLFGAAILGPLLVAAVLSLTGILHMRPPKEALLFAQFFIGIGVGVQYLGVTMKELRRDVLAGMAFAVILAATTAGFTMLIGQFGVAGQTEIFLAYAPGGQAEMAVLAIAAGADLGFVVIHHMTRLILVITGAPVALRLLRGLIGRR
ncbi:MAG: AbrB family transcriptional regulator [Pseudorhodobacter sp.]